MVFALVAVLPSAGGAQGESNLVRNGEIAFIRKGNFYDEGLLHTVKPDGSAVRRVLKSGWVRDAAWSPDGRRIAVVDKCAIKLMPATGKRLTTIVKPRSWRDSSGGGHTDCFSDIGWSPDGTRLVFMRCRNQLCPGGGGALYVVGVSGRGLRQLTQRECVSGRLWTCLQDSGPAWSPDGRTILFSRLDDDLPDPLNGNWANHARLYIVNRDGDGLVALPQHQAWAPKWSPDGTLIAFKRTVFHKPPPGATSAQSIVVMNADGSGERTLLKYDTRDVCEGWYGLQFAWSPDGTKLAVSGGCPPGIQIMDLFGGDSVAVTRRRGDRAVSWRPLP